MVWRKRINIYENESQTHDQRKHHDRSLYEQKNEYYYVLVVDSSQPPIVLYFCLIN